MNFSNYTKQKRISSFDNVLNNGIGVNEEGLIQIIPSSFSTKSGNKKYKKYKKLMNMVPNYKLPSFRLGIIEVVTAVAHAAVASKLVSTIIHLKKNLLLIVGVYSITPGWNDIHKTHFNTAFSQPDVIGRMVYESKFVTKHLQIFFNRIMNRAYSCAT